MWKKRVILTQGDDDQWTSEITVAQDQIPVTKAELGQAIRTLEVSHREYIAAHVSTTFNYPKKSPAVPATLKAKSGTGGDPVGSGRTQEIEA